MSRDSTEREKPDGRHQMNRWSRFLRLSWWERRVFVRSLALLTLAPLLLRWLRLGRGQQVAGRAHAPDPREGDRRLVEARTAARMVAAAASHGLFRPTCLEHSVVLWWLLRRRGIDCDLRIGVRRAEGRCEAHAWVEAEGVSLSHPDDPHLRFAAFDVALIPTRSDAFAASFGSKSLASMIRDIASTR